MRQSFDAWARHYADWVVRYRFWILLVIVAAAFAAASGARHLEFSTNYRVFFSDENPELVAFEEFQQTYTKNDNIFFVIQPKEENIFTPRMAMAVEWLTRESWKTPYVIRVDSISNFQNSWANEDDIFVKPLIENGGQYSSAEFDQRRAVALSEPLLRNNLISPNTTTTGINVTLQYPGKSITEVPEAVAYARSLVSQLKEKYPDLTIALSGISMLNNAFAESGQSDAESLIPIMYLILIIMLIVVFRSISATLVTVLVIGFSTVVAMGLAGYFGIQLTPISITAPTIILTLAIADSIHILITMLDLMRKGHEKISALKESLRINILPVSITSLTTVVGFLSLNFSDAPPFWHLGNITAMGIATAWLFSLMFLPALLSYLPVKVKSRSGLMSISHSLLEKTANFVIAKWVHVLAVSGTLSIVLIALAPQVDLNDQFVRYFDKRVEFRNDAIFAEKNLNGVYVIEYSMSAGNAGGINSPEYLNILAGFTKWLREQQEVMHVYSYSDIIKRLNKNMHGDEQSWYQIPKERNLAAQYLLLYELQLPYGLDLNDRINIDKSATRVSATIREISTVEIRQFLDRADKWLSDNTTDLMEAKATGATVMFSYISQRNVESMLRGNFLAVIAIALILMFALRSFSIGLVSLIPNAVPILATFGIWYLLVGQVGMAAATVTATSLGIVVDDTVHFLTKYLLARREKGLDVPDAIRYAFETVGSAIIMTTVVLMIGFSILAGSTFLINAQMGLLTAIAIVLALLTDFFLLPALLMSTHRRNKAKKYEVENNEQAA